MGVGGGQGYTGLWKVCIKMVKTFGYLGEKQYFWGLETRYRQNRKHVTGNGDIYATGKGIA
jgi:hypothetical protein